MHINYLAVFIAAVLQFLFGAVWYTPIFGKLWGKMHGFDKVPKEEQQKMQKAMMPLLAVQFLTTLVTTLVLALYLAGLPDWNTYGMAFFLWLGFVVPTQVSAVIFGGTEPKWVIKKIAVMAGASLGCLVIASVVLRAMSN